MVKMRRLFSLVVAVTLVSGLYACGGNSPSAQSSDSANTATSSNDGEFEASSPTNSETPNANYTRIETSYGASGELYYWREFKYGSDGKLESITSYRADGSESGHIDIIYDEHGTQLNEYATRGISQSTSSDGLPLPVIDETTGSVFLTNQYECGYDANGNIATKKSDKINEEYEYDNTGKCIKSYRSYPTGFIAKSYEYDDNENLISETGYDENDNLTSRILYQYDTEGHEVVQEYYDCLNSETTLRYRIEREYTAKGKLSKMSYYWYDMYSELTSTQYTVYYYDEQDTLTAYEEYLAIDGQEVLFERVECTYK